MKERLDVLLVKKGLAPSREKAKAIIMTGSVFVDGQREDKAGTAFEEEKVHIEVRGEAPKYVSRGGLKLEKAMQEFPIDLSDAVCMDIGASTGGFTDCMLQNGAARVYSVDVGHGQLAWKLRNDERVVCMEKTNFRYMQPEDIEERLDFASVDVSFISLTKILIPARNLLKENARMVCLIKPQFEAGKDKVGKKGVVREPEIHEEVIRKIITYADMIGFEVKGLSYSPIKGPEGNIEYLVFLRKREKIKEEIVSLTESEAEAKLQGLLDNAVEMSDTRTGAIDTDTDLGAAAKIDMNATDKIGMNAAAKIDMDATDKRSMNYTAEMNTSNTDDIKISDAMCKLITDIVHMAHQKLD